MLPSINFEVLIWVGVKIWNYGMYNDQYFGILKLRITKDELFDSFIFELFFITHKLFAQFNNFSNYKILIFQIVKLFIF